MRDFIIYNSMHSIYISGHLGNICCVANGALLFVLLSRQSDTWSICHHDLCNAHWRYEPFFKNLCGLCARILAGKASWVVYVQRHQIQIQ